VANGGPADVTLVVERYDDVLRLRMSNRASRAVGLDVSAYAVRGIMIDTGFHHARRPLLDAVTALEVRGVIVTHWHEDHAGNVAALAARGLPIDAAAETEATLRRRPPVRLYRRVIWGRPPALTAPLASPEIGALCLIPTPGHSADHRAVFDESTHTLFSGDLWLGVRSRAMHPSENPYEIIASLRRAAALRPWRMFDAHRGLVADPVAALEARADWLSETAAEIERRIAAGDSDRAIVRRVLGGEERSALVSRGEYARRNFVRAVRRHVAGRCTGGRDAAPSDSPPSDRALEGPL
jgi:glyoxylase-like metal-dependent hydrolase (beta-lactamase superfamily II)